MRLKDNALYFPSIAVSDTPWLTHVLLYWDKLYSIFPTEFRFDGHPQAEFMAELRDEGLWEGVRPGLYLYEFKDFQKPFLEHVDSVRNRRSFQPLSAPQPSVPIHTEKLAHVAQGLVDRGLARDRGDFWYNVDAWVANLFMTFLAVGLGQVDQINAMPITDRKACQHLLSGGGFTASESGDRRGIRMNLLQEILPVPKRRVSLQEISRFKERYGVQAKALRQRIEKETIEISNIRHLADREEQHIIRKEALIKERQEVESAMKDFWPDVIFVSVATAAWALLPLLETSVSKQPWTYRGSAAGLASALYSAWRARQIKKNPHPLAYAVNYRRRIIRK
jgi:hypothetical protein